MARRPSQFARLLMLCIGSWLIPIATLAAVSLLA